MELFEIVLNTLKESDPKAAFLRNTVGASMREYYAQVGRGIFRQPDGS